MELRSPFRNTSYCLARAFETIDRTGRDVMVVVAKLSYVVASGDVQLPRRLVPIRPHDVLNSSGPYSSVRYPSDQVDEKPGTDVLVIGRAHPPQGNDVTEFEVSFEIGARLRKALRVFGPRVWQKSLTGSLTPGPAQPASTTPIVYELAYGGHDLNDPDDPLADEYNPAGVGVCRDPERLVGTPAPRIAPLRGNRGPAGFGPIPAHWLPRAARMGTCDAEWRRWRAPVPPLDFDPRGNCCAPDDQWLETPLTGDELVRITHIGSPEPWHFKLPRYAPRFRGVVDGGERELPTHLDTFIIHADERIIELVWRASLPLPRYGPLGAIVLEGHGDDLRDIVAASGRQPIVS